MFQVFSASNGNLLENLLSVLTRHEKQSAHKINGHCLLAQRTVFSGNKSEVLS